MKKKIPVNSWIYFLLSDCKWLLFFSVGASSLGAPFFAAVVESRFSMEKGDDSFSFSVIASPYSFPIPKITVYTHGDFFVKC